LLLGTVMTDGEDMDRGADAGPDDSEPDTN
jgi:hypothetical protein